jgi:hypothetical protein
MAYHIDFPLRMWKRNLVSFGKRLPHQPYMHTLPHVTLVAIVIMSALLVSCAERGVIDFSTHKPFGFGEGRGAIDSVFISPASLNR